MANISAIKLPDGVTYNVKDNVSGYITGMTILSYGSSTWQNFIDAYNANKVVYCRASSNSNPASGSQTRLAFMAYVNNATTPTEVEFQYYRSVSSHSASQQGDQVYIYKLNKSTGWSVTVREAMSKIAAGGDLTSSYANGTITISGDIPTVPTNVSAFTNDAGYITGYTETDPIFTASAAHGISSTDITNWNNKSNFSGSYNDLTNKPTIPTISPNTVMWDENMSGSGEHGGELFYTTTGLDAEFLTDNALYENGNTVLQSTDLKTVNGNSLVGSGDITIGGNYQSGTAAMLSAGTNTTNSVWTPKILHDYVQSAVGSIGYVSKTENTYTTGSSSVSTIPIGINEYTSTDLLLVDINGLDLIQGTDYTISGTNIVLATPITTSGTKVHFVDFKLVTATVSDIATLKGDAAGFGTVSATVDSNTGTPSVTVTTSGPDTAKNMSFEFHNLKGTDGTHTISYTPIVTGGAQIGTITIDNTNYPLYAPAVVWG